MSADSGRPAIAQQVTWVYTPALGDAAPFYEGVLGLDLVLEQAGCRVYRTSATSFLGLCPVRPGRHVEPKGVVLTMVTDAIDAWYERLSRLGADVLGPPERSETYNIYAFFARDPNGYLIEFQQFLDPRWPAA